MGDKIYFDVGEDCPYYKDHQPVASITRGEDGHDITWKYITGPGGEPYYFLPKIVKEKQLNGEFFVLEDYEGLYVSNSKQVDSMNLRHVCELRETNTGFIWTDRKGKTWTLTLRKN